VLKTAAEYFAVRIVPERAAKAGYAIVFKPLSSLDVILIPQSREELQRSPETFRGEARLSISDRFLDRPLQTEMKQRCLKSWPHASHFVAALRSICHRTNPPRRT
jgi:hypothetical protein